VLGSSWCRWMLAVHCCKRGKRKVQAQNEREVEDPKRPQTGRRGKPLFLELGETPHKNSKLTFSSFLWKTKQTATTTMTNPKDGDDTNKTVITLKGSVTIVSDFFFTAINSILYQRGAFLRSWRYQCALAVNSLIWLLFAFGVWCLATVQRLLESNVLFLTFAVCISAFQAFTCPRLSNAKPSTD